MIILVEFQNFARELIRTLPDFARSFTLRIHHALEYMSKFLCTRFFVHRITLLIHHEYIMYVTFYQKERWNTRSSVLYGILNGSFWTWTRNRVHERRSHFRQIGLNHCDWKILTEGLFYSGIACDLIRDRRCFHEREWERKNFGNMNANPSDA